MSASSAAHTIPGPQVYARFPPTSQNLSEQDLDPYFNNFEAATRDLELLLEGNIEKVNRRTLTHLSTLSKDMAELGARYNAFSLSEQSPSVAAAIEKTGQASDSSYLATEELSATFGANFAEPMRESAQFAGVVRSTLRYRVMKRIQEEMTRDELTTKRQLLDSLEKSEAEAGRIEQYLASQSPPGGEPRRSTSSASARSARTSSDSATRPEGEDTASIDSDFPPTHGESISTPTSPQSPNRKSQSGGFVANKIFGRIAHAVHGVVDVDPERTRRDQIGKTKETLQHVWNRETTVLAMLTFSQLEQALEVSQHDVKDASMGVLRDLKRFQGEKEDDLRRYMVNTCRSSSPFCNLLTQLYPDCIRQMPYRLGEEERRHVERSKGRSRQDRGAVALLGRYDVGMNGNSGGSIYCLVVEYMTPDLMLAL